MSLGCAYDFNWEAFREDDADKEQYPESLGIARATSFWMPALNGMTIKGWLIVIFNDLSMFKKEAPQRNQ